MRAAGVQGVAVIATPLLKRDGAQLATLALQTGVPSGVNGPRWRRLAVYPDRLGQNYRRFYDLWTVSDGAEEAGAYFSQGYLAFWPLLG